MTVQLSYLLEGLTAPDLLPADVLIGQLTMDSRAVEPGALFLACAKTSQQRLQHLQQALELGAQAIAYEQQQPLTADEQRLLADVIVLPVAQLSQQASEIAARFYQRPSEALTVIAVTGTNGKTSVSHFIAQALEQLGVACWLIGTLGVGRPGQLQFTGMTTPDPVSLQAMLADCRQQGIAHVALEASSHALEQGRLNAVAIDIAVFTNLSRDHLDYHADMQSYAAAKQRLFEFASLRSAVINIDDSTGQQLASLLDDKHIQLLGYSCVERSEAQLRATAVHANRSGLQFEMLLEQQRHTVRSPLLGQFNVSNLLATAAVLSALQFSAAPLSQALSACQAVAGRMQAYGGDRQPTVVVDYAHTPDALAQALKALRSHTDSDADLWCVFGCGGDRDSGKRPLMGAIAEQYADRVVVTDDNPRSEPSLQIIKAILDGCQQPDKVYVEPQRQLAIDYAISHAACQDLVLVAGKGHEHYQEIAGTRYPFSDIQIVNEVLQRLQATADRSEESKA